MIRILLLGASLTLLFGCTSKEVELEITNISEVRSKAFFSEFSNYCSQTDFKSDHGRTMASWFGDYLHMRDLTKTNVTGFENFEGIFDENVKAQIINYYERILSDSSSDDRTHEEAKRSIEMVTRPAELSELFSSYAMVDAVNHITSEADKYNFLLINESH